MPPFFVIEYATDALPVPLSVVAVIQPAEALAVHAQVGALAVSTTVPVDGVAGTLTEAAPTLNVHAGTAACVTVYAWPPIVTVAVLAAPGFAATVTVALPVPVPLAGATVAHAALLDAVHPHVPSVAVTPTLDAPPAAATFADPAESVKPHGAAACVTVYAWPPIVTVAVLAAPRFAATVTSMLPVPVPLAGLTVTQAALLETVHAQVDALAVTVRPVVPPVAGAFCPANDSEYVQTGTGGGADWNSNTFEGSLTPDPAGPIAATRAW
jgi:hypothetical protein